MDRKYQIFISSTYKDLIEERNLVVSQILSNYHFPIGMEMFAADNDEQWNTIQRTIDSSDIYILIIGYRYGATDSDGVSYTEREYNYAKEKGKTVLTFFLEDENFIRQIFQLKAEISKWWYGGSRKRQMFEMICDNYYDLDQTKIAEFKSKALTKLSRSFTRSTELDYKKILVRKKDITINVQPSIFQKFPGIPTGGWVRHQDYAEKNPLEKTLIINYPILFDKATLQNLEFARVFPDGQSLETEFDFSKLIISAKKEFWINTTAFKLYYTHQRLFEDAMRRGVILKILLTDPKTLNVGESNYHFVYNPDGDQSIVDKEKLLIDQKSVIKRIEKYIHSTGAKNASNIEIKYYSKPMYYQMWIVDPMEISGLAHVNVSHYNGFKPHFRFTPKTSQRLFETLKNEFLNYWDDSDNETLF